MTKANAHALFCGLKEQPSYLSSLNVSEQQKAQLLEAKNSIRQILRETFKNINLNQDRWDPRYRRDNFDWREKSVEVKFMTQGSFAYRTLNNPSRSTQEIDLDDGMYLPVTHLENGEPHLLAKGLFNFVEASLHQICVTKNWNVEQKNSCVRVNLNSNAHIDIPIYSIPLEDFNVIIEASIGNDTFEKSLNSVQKSKIPQDKIMLATKNGEWIRSDPKKLHDWVKATENLYGPEFIRICRFLKGWRDYIWASCNLSSICIMRSVEIAFDQLEANWENNRDDALLYKVVTLLPSILDNNVENPVVSGAILNTWEATDKRDIMEKVFQLKNKLQLALENANSCEDVVKHLRNGIDERIPNCPDAVKLEVGPVVSFTSSPIISQPLPKIGTSTSG